MENSQKDNFNLQIRKLLKEFGVKAHTLVQKRFDLDTSDCTISLKLFIDSQKVEEISKEIKID